MGAIYVLGGDPTSAQGVVVGVLVHRVAECLIVARTRRYLYLFLIALHIVADRSSLEPRHLDGSIILIVTKRPWCNKRFLLFCIPQSKLLSFTLRERRMPLLGVVDRGQQLWWVLVVGGLIKYFNVGLDIASAAVTLKTVAEQAWFLWVDFFNLNIALDIIFVRWRNHLGQLSLEERATMWLLLFIECFWLMECLKLIM